VIFQLERRFNTLKLGWFRPWNHLWIVVRGETKTHTPILSHHRFIIFPLCNPPSLLKEDAFTCRHHRPRDWDKHASASQDFQRKKHEQRWIKEIHPLEFDFCINFSLYFYDWYLLLSYYFFNWNFLSIKFDLYFFYCYLFYLK